MGDVRRGINLARRVRSFGGKLWESGHDEWERLRVHDVPMESGQQWLRQGPNGMFQAYVLALTYDSPSSVRKMSDTGKLQKDIVSVGTVNPMCPN